MINYFYVLFRMNNAKPAPPNVRPKSFKPPTVNAPVRMEFQLKPEQDYGRRRQELRGFESPRTYDVNLNNNTEPRKLSAEEDAPPRPPPPKSVTPSPRAPQQFTYSTSNGYQDNSFPRSASVGQRPSNGVKPVINHGSDEPEVMDFRTKMKMFNKFQNQ